MSSSSRPILQGKPLAAAGKQDSGRQDVVEEEGSQPRRRHWEAEGDWFIPIIEFLVHYSSPLHFDKVLAEFQGVQEHREFMKNIGKEKELKSRIKDLQR